MVEGDAREIDEFGWHARWGYARSVSCARSLCALCALSLCSLLLEIRLLRSSCRHGDEGLNELEAKIACVYVCPFSLFGSSFLGNIFLPLHPHLSLFLSPTAPPRER